MNLAFTHAIFLTLVIASVIPPPILSSLARRLIGRVFGFRPIVPSNDSTLKTPWAAKACHRDLVLNTWLSNGIICTTRFAPTSHGEAKLALLSYEWVCKLAHCIWLFLESGCLSGRRFGLWSRSTRNQVFLSWWAAMRHGTDFVGNARTTKIHFILNLFRDNRAIHESTRLELFHLLNLNYNSFYQ